MTWVDGRVCRGNRSAVCVFMILGLRVRFMVKGVDLFQIFNRFSFLHAG